MVSAPYLGNKMTVILQHAINQLRTHARRDLQRFYSPNHYLGRDYAPIADFELTRPLLRAPATNELTAREVAAATALKDLAIYENRYRKIWDDAKPVRDTSKRNIAELSETENREIYALLEMFCCSALSYAKVIGAPYLIKAFEQAVPTVQATPVIETVPNDHAETKLVQGVEAGKHAEEPWLVVNLNDPEPKQPWYTPARYFARILVIDDSTLLSQRDELASKVIHSLENVGIYKRGGKKSFNPATIKKALTKINLG